MRIRNFILATSLAVGVLVFGGVWLTVGGVLDQTVKSNAVRTSDAVARVTFSAMYQVMSNGWKRAQAEAFLRATQDAGGDSGLRIEIYRGKVVADLYEEIAQSAPDAEVAAGWPTASRATSTATAPSAISIRWSPRSAACAATRMPRSAPSSAPSRSTRPSGR